MHDFARALELETDLAELQALLNTADRAAARELGIGAAEDLQVLRILLRDGPQRVGTLAKARGASVATVSARLDRMERRGLITRDRIPGDRRSVAATLTPSGESAARQSRDERLAVLARLDRSPSHRAFLPVIDALHDLVDSSTDDTQTVPSK